VSRIKKFSRTLVSAKLVSQQKEIWKFADRRVQGTTYTYQVLDRNFAPVAKWTFVIRVPELLTSRGYVEIRPTHCPPQAAFAGLDRRSINFTPARRARYRGFLYAKVFLGDTDGKRTKIGTRAGDRPRLPAYISRTNMRLKKTVTSTSGTDGSTQVKLFRRNSHRGMIRFFLSTRAWVLYNRFSM
jgi:hypothetical protein